MAGKKMIVVDRWHGAPSPLSTRSLPSHHFTILSGGNWRHRLWERHTRDAGDDAVVWPIALCAVQYVKIA